MKAIITKCLPATNTKGSRIKASDMDGNSVTISYPYGVFGEDAHRKASDALCDKMEWGKHKPMMIGGGINDGYVFVLTPSNRSYDSLSVLGLDLPILAPLQGGWFLVAHPNGPAIATKDILASLEYPESDIPESVRTSAIRELGQWAIHQPTWPRNR
jgi:hypothetical protein